jgi:hypothetical protein
MKELRSACRFWSEYHKEGDHLGDSGVNGMILLKWVSGKYSVKLWIAFCRFRIGFGDILYL